MVKTVYNYASHLSPDLGKHPPPPPLPHYDPNEEAPKWDWYRLMYNLPKFEKHPDLPQRVGGLPDSDDKPDWRGVIKNNVIPLPKVEPYKFHTPESSKYFYFDTPDYADPFKKLWYSFKWFSLTGGLIASFMGIIENRSFSLKDNRNLFARFVGPWVMGGMAFSTAAITIANLRGNKDGFLNYVGGGLVAGAATGRANYIAHFRHTILWTVAGCYVKYNAEVNGNMSLRLDPYMGSLGMSGMSAEGGILTGNLHFWKSHPQGDPGRDARGLTI